MAQQKKLLSFLILGGLLLVLFLPMLLGRTLFFGDNYSLMVPGKLFTAFWLRQGLIPLWNPYLFGGIPWIGDINQSVLYPSSLLFAMVHPGIALNLTVILHLIMSGFGMFWLVREWLKLTKDTSVTPKKRIFVYLLATILWLFSQKLIGSVNNLSILQSLSWMPWVVWAGLGVAKKNKNRWKKQFIFAILAALQLSAGYPQISWLSMSMAVMLSGWLTKGQAKLLKLWFLDWIRSGLLALGLSAVIWLPFLPVLQQSTRVIQSASQAVTGSVHPLEIFKLVVPYIFEKPMAGVKWGPNWNRTPSEVVYLTWFVLLAGSWKLWTRKIIAKDLLLLVVSAIFLLLSFGEFIPGFSLVQQILPVFKVVRNPGIMLIVPSLLLPLWIAPAVFSIKWQARFWQRILLASLVMLAFVVLLVTISFTSFEIVWRNLDSLLGSRLSASYFHTLEKDRLIFQMFTQSLLVASVGLVVSIWAARSNKYWLLLVIIGLDLVYHSSGSLFFAPVSIYPSWQEINQQATSVPIGPTHNSRYLIRNSNKPYTDFNTYWEALAVRRPFTDSFIDQQEMKDFVQLSQMSRGLTPDWHMVYRVPAINGYTTLLPQDVNQTWNSSDQPAINTLPEISLDQPELANWAVKRYLVDNGFAVEEDLLARSILSTTQRWQTYQLLSNDRFRLKDGPRLGLVEVDETPNQVVVRLAPVSTEAEVIIADRYDPAWKALVQGKPTSIQNHQGMMGLSIPADTSQIVLTYQPSHFYWGLLISLLTAFYLVGWWIGWGWFTSLKKLST